MIISERRLRKFYHAAFSLLNKKLIIININYMGIGNRLKFLATYHVNYGLDNTTLFWNRQGWVNCRLGDIIQIEGIESFKEYAMPPNGIMVPIICHPSKPCFWERGFWRFDIGRELPDDFYIVRHGLRFPSIDFCYERTPPWEIERYMEFFRRLKPSEAVRERMAEVEVGPDDVCVQVRNTVDEQDMKDVAKLPSIIERMRSFPSDTRFFISTLDASISQVFYEAFGERIIELPQKQYRSMIDATADMYLLGKGQVYLVSPGSTFGEVAWWLGGCRQKVIQMSAEIFPA